MKNGFTLLELLVVIIIISILATLGAVQYGNVVERGRSSEAKHFLSVIRDAYEQYLVLESDKPPTNFAALGLTAITANTCDPYHFFDYSFTAPDANGDYTITARRCDGTGGHIGKPPDIGTAYTVELYVDKASLSSHFTVTGAPFSGD